MDFSAFFITLLDTSQALPATHEPSLVVASYVIAALAGFAFLRFAGRIVELSDSVLRFVWMAAGAVAMGLGVWAMHFVAMLAYRLPIPVSYDPLITTLSVLPAVIGSAAALYVVARPTVTMSRLLAGAIVMGAGIGTMHYTGMAALNFDAFLRYDPILFATSIVVAVVLAFAALFTTFWSMKRRENRLLPVREATGALFMGFAVSGMHYTAMTSAYCFAAPHVYSGHEGIDYNTFAAMTTIVAVLVLLMTIAGIVFDRRLRQEIASRERVQAQLQQAQKMEALGNLAGGIAHDFNNMLLPIMALTELTMQDLPENHEGRENLESVLEAARHAQYLVNQVMIFSRQDERDIVEVDVSPAVGEAIQFLRERIPPRIAIIGSIDPDVGVVMADTEQIRSLIMSLGLNAADAMDGGTGEIHVTLSRIDAERNRPDIDPALDKKRGYARLSVRDTGSGMDSETLGKIFNPFFTTKPVGEGTGLGLAMVHGIIRRFDGIVNVSSEPGVGTTFDIFLPLLSAGERQAIPDKAAA